MATATLHDYYTGAEIRQATHEEIAASLEAARWDGGAGVILLDTDTGEILAAEDAVSVDAWRVYVQQ